jgi:hypothetical protein
MDMFCASTAKARLERAQVQRNMSITSPNVNRQDLALLPVNVAQAFIERDGYHWRCR